MYFVSRVCCDIVQLTYYCLVLSCLPRVKGFFSYIFILYFRLFDGPVYVWLGTTQRLHRHARLFRLKFQIGFVFFRTSSHAYVYKYISMYIGTNEPKAGKRYSDLISFEEKFVSLLFFALCIAYDQFNTRPSNQQNHLNVQLYAAHKKTISTLFDALRWKAFTVGFTHSAFGSEYAGVQFTCVDWRCILWLLLMVLSLLCANFAELLRSIDETFFVWTPTIECAFQWIVSIGRLHWTVSCERE